MTQTPTSATRAVVLPEPTGRRARRPRKRPQGMLAFGHWWWALPGILLVLGIHYASTAVGGFFAFTDWTGLGAFQLIGLDNFVEIFSDPTKIGAVGNTLFLAIASVIITNVAGLGIAVGLNRGLKSRYVLRTLFFMPVVLSPLAVSYIWKFIFDYNGPFNGFLGMIGLEEAIRPWLADPEWAIWIVLVVISWQNTGFAMVIYMAGLAAVPVEIEEAAAIDGANLWQRFWHVTLPSIRPAVAIATTLGLVNGLRIFDQIMALTGGGPAGATETLATEVYKESFALGNFGYGAALALILTLIILVFAVIQQRLTGERREA
ncbi:sugar ABC transporter permease [Salinibacterium sp. SYSU T00001]|uniref:carbohydrate ABC transporter permease n=1 Tax=Homoserinimonas sedimenticola TaxID=2986805 RepID=UPI0022358599|nr:sugar ABC transporter permease [Salinibacterium sedimenticola]MCW4385899.1 sugar ABC transporter permease [Salinibacterium sedimenticola]